MFLHGAEVSLPAKPERACTGLCAWLGGVGPQKVLVGQRDGGLLSGPTWVSPVVWSVSFNSSQSTASPLVCQSLCGSFKSQTLFNRHERSVVSVVMSGYREQRGAQSGCMPGLTSPSWEGRAGTLTDAQPSRCHACHP